MLIYHSCIICTIVGWRMLGKHKEYTEEPVLKDRPVDHKNIVCQDRWSLVTGSVALKCNTFCQEYVVLQDRSLMAVVSQDRFHCIYVQSFSDVSP